VTELYHIALVNGNGQPLTTHGPSPGLAERGPGPCCPDPLSLSLSRPRPSPVRPPSGSKRRVGGDEAGASALKNSQRNYQHGADVPELCCAWGSKSMRNQDLHY
jgi:hypothetical protein